MPLEKVGYDLNEPNSEPFDDSAPLNLVGLEDDTIKLYQSDEKTDEVVLTSPTTEVDPVATTTIPPAPIDVPSTSTDRPPPLADLAPASMISQLVPKLGHNQ